MAALPQTLGCMPKVWMGLQYGATESTAAIRLGPEDQMRFQKAASTRTSYVRGLASGFMPQEFRRSCLCRSEALHVSPSGQLGVERKEGLCCTVHETEGEQTAST
jgi:hypothetical protein